MRCLKKLSPAALSLVCFTTLFAVQVVAEESRLLLEWKKLPPLPDALGFAGPFVGTSGDALIVAGGANFPEKPPWDGGKKIWYDTGFVLEKKSGQWQQVFKLPRLLGYGISVTTPDGIICIGGSDAREHVRDVFRLRWQDGKVSRTELPPLPQPLANACGALVGETIYVAGGIATPDATNALKIFWSLNLAESDAGWRELETWPGPARMLSVAAALGDSFFLISGVDLSAGPDGKPVRQYLKDAYRYQSGHGWKKIADVPLPAVAAPSPALVLDEFSFAVFGGDDGSKVGFQPIAEHPGFSKKILRYDSRANSWKSAGEIPVASVTTSATEWNGDWIIPSGEIRPGVRTPEVWAVHRMER